MIENMIIRNMIVTSAYWNNPLAAYIRSISLSHPLPHSLHNVTFRQDVKSSWRDPIVCYAIGMIGMLTDHMDDLPSHVNHVFSGSRVFNSEDRILIKRCSLYLVWLSSHWVRPSCCPIFVCHDKIMKITYSYHNEENFFYWKWFLFQTW